MNLLITGTNTEVGKTVLTAALAAYGLTYLKNYDNFKLMKLLQTGLPGDKEFFQSIFATAPQLEIITPISFTTPIAPPLAAAKEGKKIDLASVWQVIAQAQNQKDWLLIEALGGLGSPVTAELTVADIAGDWRLPTVLVVSAQLGAISQAVANVALARQARVNLKGIVISCPDKKSEAHLADLAPRDMIESFTNVPVLGVLPYLANLQDISKLATVASNLDLEIILPAIS
ncbi:MAG: ATP-dependent dethiobiotin synthetase BioD [Cyanobacteria bacterium J083]|nr:MAG: ATP-dependent dethiobiotin synthetase BioD [Cyanobacteria bacterium J083]